MKESKASTRKVSSSDFDNLVLNGIDFLEKAISQLDSDPKHSVINFYTAVEIFLKAPLVHDHWTLVVLDKDFNRQKYEDGDFLSVSFEDSCARLAGALKKPLNQSAKDAFNKIRKHRNRIVHFFHSGIDGKQRDAIKLEQAQAWFELNRFITDTWGKQFEPYEHDFRVMESSLIANINYAKTKYEDLKPRIEGLKKSGLSFERCPYCKTDAYQVSEDASRLTSGHCLVCFHSEKIMQIDCPKCGDQDQHMSPYDGFFCNNCNHRVVGASQVFDLLDENKFRGTKHDLDSNTPANCDECQGHHTICEYDGGYLCTNCFAYFDEIGQCEWCNEPMSGNTEYTYVNGCEHCEGQAGWHAND